MAGACLCLVGFINCYSVRLSNMVQDYLTYAKVVALIIIVATGMVQLGRGRARPSARNVSTRETVAPAPAAAHIGNRWQPSINFKAKSQLLE